MCAERTSTPHSRRSVYVDLPDEDVEEGMCGKLCKSMYGTRGTAQNWEKEYESFMKRIGFRQGRASPCVFHHLEREVRIVIHGDDFTCLGHTEGLDWFRKDIPAVCSQVQRKTRTRGAG